MRFRFYLCLTALVCLFSAAVPSVAQQISVRRSSNLRQEPNTQSQILGSLHQGDTVTLTTKVKNNGYYPVKTTDGKTGWIWAKNVTAAQSLMAMRRTGNLAVAEQFVSSCENPSYPGKATVMDKTSCPGEGNGGREASQNEAKNNFCATGDPRPSTIADLVQLQQQVEANGSIPFGESGVATDRSALEGIGEGTSVVLTGYVKIARKEGAESVNCGQDVPNQPAYHDIHISIVNASGDSECSGIVAEMIPHHRPVSWTPDLVNKVRDAGLQVKLTGNLMFDSSHTPCTNGSPKPGNPSRAALWEVHPIYKFEVCTQADCSAGEGWVSLENWQPE
jgi:hypothetical protein